MAFPRRCDKLLELASQALSDRPLTNIEHFIIALKIEDGDEGVNPDTVYATYLIWNGWGGAVRWVDFSKEFNQYFTKIGARYMFKEGIFNASKEYRYVALGTMLEARRRKLCNSLPKIKKRRREAV